MDIVIPIGNGRLISQASPQCQPRFVLNQTIISASCRR